MFAAILGVCLLNGLTSPILPIVVALAPVWMPEIIPLIPETVFHGASLVVAFGTLLIGGVPAALYERLSGQERSDTWSMGVWLASVTVLSLPGISRLI